ncbi:MAG: helix-turn-helix transcriptional regulator [Butyrivibrio sp.]|nr:helix-turn-helix transcriptional regulator [Butyrivibrio sp.]
MDVLYENIARLRREHNMTQAQLAEKVGYTANTMIAHIEQGTVDLPYSKILKFAEVFGVSAPELQGFASDELQDKYSRLTEAGKQYVRDCIDFATFKYTDKANS